MQNTFGNESFIDVLAAAAGVDRSSCRLRKSEGSARRGMSGTAREPGELDPAHGARGAERRCGERTRAVVHQVELVRTYVGVVADSK